jgi:cation diffusion facilitator family transporter
VPYCPKEATITVSQLLPHSHHHHNVASADLTESGIRALKVSLAILGATAAAQAVVVSLSGSVGLLADTVHNFSDALVALPLWFAFAISKRKATPRYPYGFYRIEDLVGLGVVLIIAASAVWTGYESIERLLHPTVPRNIPLVIAAGLVGGLGNEIVARYRLKVGREIHSHALMAEGHHARVDALTSFGVVVGLVFVALGFSLADPLAGLVITILILSVVFEVGKDLLTRILGKAEDRDLEEIRTIASGVEGVKKVGSIKVQWLGHRCFAEMCVAVSPLISVADAHHISENVRHELLHHLSSLVDVTIHADPYAAGVSDPFHNLTAHHF